MTSAADLAQVPDQFRGTPQAKAKMHRRCSTVVERIAKSLKAVYPAARAVKVDEEPAAATPVYASS